MRIGIIGGTGSEGKGLALRWARAGHDVCIGSRDGARGEKAAAELTEQGFGTIGGSDQAGCTADADLVVLSVPYSAHADTLSALKETLQGHVLVDITVPLKPPKVREVHLPEGQSAALEAQALLGEGVRVVAGIHHVGAAHLNEVEALLEGDVLMCSNDQEALDLALGLAEDLGVRALDAGKLKNAVALESLTPVLLHINRKYKAPGAGLHITGLPL